MDSNNYGRNMSGYPRNVNNGSPQYRQSEIQSDSAAALPASTLIQSEDTSGSRIYGTSGPPQSNYRATLSQMFSERPTVDNGVDEVSTHNPNYNRIPEITANNFIERPVQHTFTEQSDSAQWVEPTKSNESEVMMAYKKRLATFSNGWPADAPVTAVSVAKAGMSYIGPEDRVQCNTCRGILYSFDEGDVPIDEHRNHFRLCPSLSDGSYEKLERELSLLQDPQLSTILSHQFQDISITDIRKSNNDAYTTERINDERQFSVVEQAPVNINTNENSPSDIFSLPAVQIVKKLGFSDENIQQAVNLLICDLPIGTINTAKLLEKLYELED